MDKPTNTFYCFGPFRIDAQKRMLFKGEEPVSLAPKAFDLLLALVENRGLVLVKDDLMQKVWPDQIVEDANITVNMSALRKALGENPHEHLYIVTIPGRGYRFVADVSESHSGFGNLIVEQLPASRTTAFEQVKETSAASNHVEIERAESKPKWRLSRAIAAACALSVVVGALIYLLVSSRSEQALTGAIKSIAVLPFKPMSQDARDEYLEIGMADSLITKLSGMGHIVVRPVSAVRQYTDLEQDPVAAGRELKVEAVLDGSIQRTGERVRVTVRLVKVADGNPIWAGQFDEKFTDVFAVEDSVSERLARALEQKLSGDEAKLLTKHYTNNIEAYQLYLRGRYQMSYGTAEGLMNAIESYQLAIEKDPKYALAYVGLADAHAGLGFGNGQRPPAEQFSKARAAATAALEIDSELADAHAALALIEFHFDWNWPAAEKHYNRAIELNSNLAEAHEGYSQYLAAMGRMDEALTEIELAERLDPLSLVIKMHRGLVLYGQGRYDEAIAAYRETLGIDPRFNGAHALLGWVYEKKGMYEEAIRELEEAGRLNPNTSWRLAGLAHAYALSGRRDAAIKILDQLREVRNKSYVSAFYIAEIYAALDDKDHAFEWLEKAYDERDSGMAYLKTEDRLANLFPDPRFQDLLRRMRFTQ